MTEADISAPHRTRVGVAMVVLALHVIAVLALVRAFAPDFARSVADDVGKALTVVVSAPPPSPPPPEAPDPAGKAGQEGRKANPREAIAPKVKLPLAKKTDAPPVKGKGDDNQAGAGDQGRGPGNAGDGNGPGAGGGGDGTGGGTPRKLEKTAGEINSARDYPKKTRKDRSGKSVTIQMTVGTDGHARNCRVTRSSGNAEADAITCRLAEQRFRFRAKTDGAGNPVAADYAWTQRWWDPRDDDAED